MQVLFVYILVSLFADYILLTHSYKDFPRLTITVFSFFTILEYTLFSLFLFLIIKNKYFKRVILTISIFFLSFFLFNYFSNINAPKKFDSAAASIESILIIIYCIFFFFDQINNPEIVMIYESHRFWAITGFLIYMAGELFLFIYADELTNQQRVNSWTINTIANLIKDVLIGVTIVMNKKNINLNSKMNSFWKVVPLNFA